MTVAGPTYGDQTTVAKTFTLNLKGGTLQSAASTANLIDTNGGASEVTVLLGAGNAD